MNSFQKFQMQLLGQAKSKYEGETALSDLTIQAFEDVPRHLFVEKYRHFRHPEWYAVTEDNIEQHLSSIYADSPLVLIGSDADFDAVAGTRQVSTISQPSFVLRMLDLLQIEPGHNIFELGTASGWNAALMSKLTGPHGKVVTAEIIPELAKSAQERLSRHRFTNVKVVEGDGGDGLAAGGPFDRIMFTAGAFDLPRTFYHQIREGGILLFVLKNKGGSDSLIRLVKIGDHFESTYIANCGFVPLTGKYHMPEMEDEPLDALLRRSGISSRPINSRSFWWGSGTAKFFIWETVPFRSFLSLSDKHYCAIRNAKGEAGFAWLVDNSLAVAQSSELVSYGSSLAAECLVEDLKNWVDLGMPTPQSFTLKVYPSGVEVRPRAKHWVSARRESTFLWSLS